MYLWQTLDAQWADLGPSQEASFVQAGSYTPDVL